MILSQITETKLCGRCKETKPYKEFNKKRESKDGYYVFCRRCVAPDPEKYDEKQRMIGEGVKSCSKCNEVKTFDNFYTRPSRAFLTLKEKPLMSHCKCCELIEAAQSRQANIDKFRSREREYYRKDLEKSREKGRINQRNRDPEVKKRAKMAYNKANPERKKKWARDSHNRHRETNCQRIAKWQRENRGKTTAYGEKCRAQRMGVKGKFTNTEWLALCEKYGNICLCCGKDGLLCRDHVIAMTKPGATNTIDNLQPLCKSCNSRKHARVIDFRPDRSSVVMATLPGGFPYLPLKAGVRRF